eukprot:3245485-Rhodomonas_salina.1
MACSRMIVQAAVKQHSDRVNGPKVVDGCVPWLDLGPSTLKELDCGKESLFASPEVDRTVQCSL